MNITGQDKAAILAALHNRAKPQGMGFLHYDPKPMTRDEAEAVLEQFADYLYFDYLKGRVMKVDLRGNDLSFRLYDRDNGDGAGERAVLEVLTAPAERAKEPA